MADKLPPVVIELKLELDQMKQQIKAATSEIERLGSTAKNSTGGFDSLGSSATKFAATIGVLAVANKVFRTGIEETKQYTAGVAQLEAGLRSTGNVANVTVQGMTDLASSIQKTTGQTDDSIMKTQQLLLTFTNIRNVGPDKIFDDTTRAAADMAAKLGGDAAGNAIQLGKALNDPTRGLLALRRAGVSFSEAQVNTIKSLQSSGHMMEAQKVILQELQVEFGGAAEAAGNSFAGQLDKAQRSFEDMSQSIITAFMPAIVAVTEWFQKFMEVITPFAPVVVALVAAFGAYKIAMMGVAAAQALYNGVVALSTIATEGFTFALASTGIGAIIIGVGLLTAALLGLNAAVGGGAKATNTAAVNAGEAARKKAEDAFKKANPGKTSTYFEHGEKKTYTALSPAEMREMKRVGQEAYDRAVRIELQSEDQRGTSKKIAADKAAKDKAAKDAAALNKLLGGGSGNKSMVDALTTAFQKFNTAVASAQSQFNKNSQNLLSQHMDNVAQVIAAKKGELNDAFKQAVQVDSGSLLAEVGGSISSMILALKNKLSGAKKLSDDAGKLAGLGYSQEFVQQIISQGPQVGDQLAQQLFKASPEQAAQVQELIAQMTDFSKTGVESTAQKYVTSQAFLVGALKDENTAYANSLNQLVRDHEVAMAKLQVSRDNAAIKALQADGVTTAEAKAIKGYRADITKENAIISAGGTTINTTVNATTNATPDAIASATVSAIKFNAPVVLR